MIRIPSKVVWLLLLAAVTAAPARAQVTTGLPPFGSFGGGSFDTVNNANLNVHFAIPVFSKVGRGVPFYYLLSYDSSVWRLQGSSGNQTWVPADDNWGWRGVTSASTGYMAYAKFQKSCYYAHQYYYWNDYYFSSYYDQNGTPHLFGKYVSDWEPGYCGSDPYPYSDSGTVIDGSGYTITVTADPSAMVQPRSGLTIYPPVGTQVGNGSIYDTNGNSLHTSYSHTQYIATTTFTDTLAMTALTVAAPYPPDPPSSTTYTYTNPTGGSSNYTVNYSLKTIETHFACSGVTDYGRTTQMTAYLVTSVDLPDNTSYGITYESTLSPNHTGAVTGRLASVQLRTGGTIVLYLLGRERLADNQCYHLRRRHGGNADQES